MSSPAPHPEPFFTIDGLPVEAHRRCATREEARAARKGRMELCVEHETGLIYNRAFDAALVRYDASYGNPLHHSGVFRTYAERLADEIVERAEDGRTIVEVGCGDGWFLKRLRERTDAPLIGFEPSGRSVELKPNTRIIGGPFDARLVDSPVGAIVCRQVLEHVEDPVEFLRGFAPVLDEQSTVLIEVPNGELIFDGDPWSLLYEHRSMFDGGSLGRVLARAGLEPEGQIQEAYGGQFLTVWCRPGNAPAGEPDRAEAESLASRVREPIERARERVTSFGRAVVWGAGTRGITYLNLVDPGGSLFEGAIDINPDKHASFVPATGTPIVGPDQLPVIRPDTVVLMNPIYEREVRDELGRLGVRARIESPG